MSSIDSSPRPPHPSIGSPARLRSFFQIAHPELPQHVLLQFIPLRLGIDAKYARRVQSEYIFFHLKGQKLIARPFDQLIWTLEPSKRFDLPLWRTIPDRVRSPEHMIGAKGIDDLPEQMCADRRMSRDELRKGRAELHIDILDSRLRLLHAAKLGGPRNFPCLRKHGIHRRGVLQP